MNNQQDLIENKAPENDPAVIAFKEIWGNATPQQKKTIFDVIWNDVEEVCFKAHKLPPCPYERIKDLYHEILPLHPRVVKLSSDRKRHIKARWREYPSIEYWRQFFDMVSKVPFLTGKEIGSGGRPYVADIDFLIKESSWIKVMEGKYTR